MTNSDELLWSNTNVEDYIWDEELGYLGNLLINYAEEKIKNCPLMLITAGKVNWQGKSGQKIINLGDNGLDVARQVIPDYSNNFHLLKTDDGTIYARVSSHDVPTGSTWNFIPMNSVENALDDIRSADTIEEIKEVLKNELGLELEVKDITSEIDDRGYTLDEDADKLIEFGDGSIIVELNDEDITTYFYQIDDEGIEKIYMDSLMEGWEWNAKNYSNRKNSRNSYG